MSVEIIVALITEFCTLAGVIITVIAGNNKTSKQLKEQTQLTLYRIEQLEKKQDKHNSLIERVFKIEQRLDDIDNK